jgi:phospholipid-binding lipoprotein MlaA
MSRPQRDAYAAVRTRTHGPGSLVLAAWLVVTTSTAYAADDALESFNRATFAFNNAVLDYVIDPIAGFSQTSVSPRLRQAGHNFYENLSEWEFVVTNLMEGNYTDSRASAERLVINTTVGVGGLFDPATGYGLTRRETEWGEAVCSFGVPPGSYLVLPLIGPANTTSFGVIAVVFAGGYVALGQIATWLVVFDVVTDVATGAASLRHVADRTDAIQHDPYVVQRSEYLAYLEHGCPIGAAGVSSGNASTR